MDNRLIESGKVIVLGAASWLGYLLINRLLADDNFFISGSLHRQKPDFPSMVNLFFATQKDDYQSFLLENKPTVIVNFLRGEDPEGFAIHQDIITYCSNHQAHYIYASSVLALDAYGGIPLTEDLTAKSSSPYGIFKASCERLLYDSKIDWTILRFASVQGWVPHKQTRNEVFLKKMLSNEPVDVDRGVIQNRMMADVLVAGIHQIISRRITGILHFGSTDSSEEYHFLKRVAQAFGYPKTLVLEGNSRNINLVAVPSKIFSSLGRNFMVTEHDTLQSLLAISALATYSNPTSE